VWGAQAEIAPDRPIFIYVARKKPVNTGRRATAVTRKPLTLRSGIGIHQTANDLARHHDFVAAAIAYATRVGNRRGNS